MKRIIDIAGASLILALASPVMLLLLIVLPSPVLFRQVRVGARGELFTMYKLRSMRVGASSAWHSGIKSEDDQRVTRVGRWLRRTSLDELPQLFNVLEGSMSLVGPRPSLPGQVPFTYRCKPGLTGPMQVGGRDTLPMYERWQMEYEYDRHHTVLGDLRILAQTPAAVLSRKGAY